MEENKKTITVTAPLLPNLEEFNELLKEIWASKWITNNGSFHKQLEKALCEYLKVPYNITLLVAQGAAIVAYVPVGIVASKLGRKKTILAGVAMLAAAFLAASFIKEGVNPIVMYALFALAGIGWATINVNSFPMVVELAKGGDVGKYTGFYYTASMAAQIVTPIASGFLIGKDRWWILFPYAAFFVGCAFVTMFFVKHGDSKPETQGTLEALGGADD